MVAGQMFILVSIIVSLTLYGFLLMSGSSIDSHTASWILIPFGVISMILLLLWRKSVELGLMSIKFIILTAIFVILWHTVNPSVAINFMPIFFQINFLLCLLMLFLHRHVLKPSAIEMAAKILPDDKLGRNVFVNALYKQINDCQTFTRKRNGGDFHDNLVVCIDGKWGDGKTFVIDMLKQKFDKEQYIEVNLDPWAHASNKDASIIAGFFNELTIEIHKKCPSLSDQYVIQEYAHTLMDGVSKKYGLDRFLNIGHDQSQNQLKIEVQKLINKSKKKILLIIDDIDRLQQNEILSILKLVRASADFDNMTVILSMDTPIIIKHLEGLNFEANYLEKICNITAPLPPIRQVQLLDYLVEEIEDSDLSEHYHDSLFYFEKIVAINSPILRSIKNIRAVKRILSGVYQYHHLEIEGGVPLFDKLNFVDVLSLETIKYICPEAYRFISSKDYESLYNEDNNKVNFSFEQFLPYMQGKKDADLDIKQKKARELANDAYYILQNILTDELEGVGRYNRLKNSGNASYYFNHEPILEQITKEELSQLAELPSAVKLRLQLLRYFADGRINFFNRKYKNYFKSKAQRERLARAYLMLSSDDELFKLQHDSYINYANELCQNINENRVLSLLSKLFKDMNNDLGKVLDQRQSTQKLIVLAKFIQRMGLVQDLKNESLGFKDSQICTSLIKLFHDREKNSLDLFRGFKGTKSGNTDLNEGMLRVFELFQKIIPKKTFFDALIASCDDFDSFYLAFGATHNWHDYINRSKDAERISDNILHDLTADQRSDLVAKMIALNPSENLPSKQGRILQNFINITLSFEANNPAASIYGPSNDV